MRSSVVWSRPFVYVYLDKKRAVWGFTSGISPVSVICSLVEFVTVEKGLTTSLVPRPFQWIVKGCKRV